MSGPPTGRSGSRRLAVEGVSFHVELRQPAARPPAAGIPPVVLLHGFTGSASTWEDLATSLAGAGHAVVAVDLIGHGASDAPEAETRYAIERVADDLVSVLGTLDHEQARWLGYSLGGRVALLLAARHPASVAALVLEGATAGLADSRERKERARADDALAGRIERIGVTAFVEEWERLPLWSSQRSLPETVRARLRAQRLGNDAGGLARALRGMSVGRQPSLWEELGSLRAPTLLLTGALDEKFTAIAREMAHALPNATMERIEGAGHAAHLERPRAFAEAVLRFLDGEDAAHSTRREGTAGTR